MDKNKGRRSHGTQQAEQTVAQKYAVRIFIPHRVWYTSFGRIRKSLEVMLTVDEYRQLFHHIWNNSLSFLQGRKVKYDEVVQNAHVLAVRFITHYFAIPNPDDPEQWQPLLDALALEEALNSIEFEAYGFQLEVLQTTNPLVLKAFKSIVELRDEQLKLIKNENDSKRRNLLALRRAWGQWLHEILPESKNEYGMVMFPFSNLVPDTIPVKVPTVDAEPFEHTLEGYCYLLETFSPYGLTKIGNALARLHQPKHKVDIGAAVDFVHKLTELSAIHGSDLPELYADYYSSKASHHARKLKMNPSFPMVAAILAHMIWTLLRKSTHRRSK